MKIYPVNIKMECKRCTSILGKYAKPHPKMPCPLTKALYCGQCAVYGHALSECTRSSQDDVELSHPILLCESKPEYEITNADGPIRAALLANDIVPMVCQEKGKKLLRDFHENKRRLLEFAKKRGQTIVFVESEMVV